MRRKRFYAFIVSSQAESKLRKISLPYPALIAIAVFSGIGLVTAGIAAFHYTRMALKVVDYNKLLAENNEFRSQNRDYRIQTVQLGEKVEFLEDTARRLGALAGVNSERGVGGAGGVNRSNFAEPRLSQTGSLAIEAYNRRVDALESQYRGVEERLAERVLVESTRPSIPPLKGYITGGMGRREDPIKSGFLDYHTGVDISAQAGNRVNAPGDGIVIFAGLREGYGNIVVIDHKFGLTSRYGHLSRFAVQVGQRISRGDAIGYVGSSGRTTGPHLHFEILQHNKPLNPMKFIPMLRRG